MNSEKSKMTNEEYNELKRIATFVFKKYYSKYNDNKDDLISCGISRMWKGFENWDENKSNRISYLCLLCRSGMCDFLRKEYLGYRKYNVLNTPFVSLSTPIGEDGEDTLVDLIDDERNVFEEKINCEILKLLIYETLEDMKEYTAKGKLKNSNLYKVVPLYIKTHNYQTVATKLGFTREFVRICINKFRIRFKSKLIEKEYFS